MRPFIAMVQPLYKSVTALDHADQMTFYGINVARGYLPGCYASVCGCLVDDSRNEIVKAFLADSMKHVTHLLWADDDMKLPWSLDGGPDTIPYLLGADKDVIGGTYFGHDGAATLVAWSSLTPPARLADFDPNGIQKVAGIGMGCTLIKTDVYRRMEEKYKDQNWYNKAAGCGEDYGFCKRCEEMGIEIFMDGRILCEHTTQLRVDYKAWKMVNGLHLT